MKHYQVYQTNGEGMSWELSLFLAKELNLAENRLVALRCGSLSVQAKVVIAGKALTTENSMGLSAEALNALKIPHNIYLAVKPIDSEEFSLGPIIGILTFPHVIQKKQLRRYTNYATRMKKAGLLYVFRPFDIHSNLQTSTGFRYDVKKKTWEFGEFPCPDVVMDRMYPNDYETHFELEKVIGQKRIFNKKTLIDKIEFKDVLERDPFLQNFIPETKIFTGTQDLDYYLSKYNGVFLKPLNSMRGRGIINVTLEGDEIFSRHMNDDTVIIEKLPRADSIFEVLERENDKQRPYLIQAAVNIMKYMERVISFRVMTIKNDHGDWSVPIIVGQAARPGAFLTNISSGAEYVSIENFFAWNKKQLPYENVEFLNQLNNLPLKAAAALDNEFGPLGKLGIDVVIDKSGKPWLIEANGNPGVIFRKGQQEFPDWHRQMYKYPLSYARYLAGFTGSQT